MFSLIDFVVRVAFPAASGAYGNPTVTIDEVA